MAMICQFVNLIQFVKTISKITIFHHFPTTQVQRFDLWQKALVSLECWWTKLMSDVAGLAAVVDVAGAGVVPM